MAHSKRPTDVFTPRAANVNASMYVDRPALQVALKSAINGSLNIVIHGESGTGKSWLYKHVFAANKIAYMTANMANAARLGSLSAEFQNLVDREGLSVKTEYTEKKEFGLSTPVMSGKLDHTGKYTIGSKEPFERCLELLRAKGGNAVACLVLDNLEAIFEDEKFMRELANILVLLDDERYAPYRVKLVVVGVPDDVKRYFARVQNSLTVANRLNEIPEVARLSSAQASELIMRGLVTELGYEIPPSEQKSVFEYIAWVTDRIPQQVHEFCLEAAQIAELHEGRLTLADMELAARRWMNMSLTSSYVAIEAMMNSRETQVGRRNQTLFALGHFDGEDFKYSDIEKVIRKEFPSSTKNTELNIVQMLADLAAGDTPIIKRTPKGDGYRFVAPKYRSCIRAMLRKSSRELVEKVDIKHIP